MTRRYADPVEVYRRDELPVGFTWRGRSYVVTAVLAQWVESGGWWRGGERSSPGGEALAVTALPATPRWGQRAWGEPAPDVGVPVVTAGVDDRERELWRVEARAGRSGATGVFDLCFDWSRGAWQLVRALD